MKNIRLIMGIFLMLLVGVIFVACTPSEGEDPDINKLITISLNEQVVEIAQGEMFTLIATVINSDAAVVWSSSNEQVATVDNGVVTGVTQGTATITAAIDDVKATATVVVSAEPFPVLTISQNTVELLLGGEGILVTSEVTYDGQVVTTEFTWTVTDANIATVTDGLIEPLAIGETEVLVSTTYNGEHIEQRITVIVNVDASVILSKYSVELDVVDIDGNQTLEDIITISAFIEGIDVPDQTFTLEIDNEDIISYDLVDQTITITSLAAGTTNLTVSFIYENIKVFSIIEISVRKSTYDIEDIVYYDLSNPENQPLDFESLGITDTVISIMHENEVVSVLADASLLSPTWIESISNGETKHVTIETAFVTYNLEIIFAIVAMDVAFDLTAENNVNASYVFNNDSKVYTYNTGLDTNAWANRLETTQAFIQTYDFMIFDIELSETLTGNMNFWMDMAVGDLNVTVLKPDGTRTNDRLFIFDTNKDLVSASLSANTVYTFVIKLGTGDPEGRYAFGINQDTTVYLSNMRATTTHYVQSNFNFGDALKDSKIDINFELTSDNLNNATLLYSPNDNAYEYKTGTSGNAWESRIATNNQEIRAYGYIVFNLMLTEPLTKDINLWMDDFDDSNLTTLHPDGTRTNNRLIILDSNNQLVTQNLDVGIANIYTFIIKLGHGETPGIYGLGFNEETTVWLRNIYATDAAYIEANFNIDLSDENPDPVDPDQNELPATLDFVDREDPSLTGASATITIGEDGVYEIYTGIEGHWDTRMHIQELESSNFKYFIFNLKLTTLLTGDVAFWMDMSSVTVMNANGTKSTSKVKVYDNSMALVTGPLQVDTYYTVVVELGHSDERHALGFMDETTVYIKNPTLANQSFLDELLGEGQPTEPDPTEPDQIDPDADTNDIIFDLTPDNNVNASLDYNEAINAFIYNTGISTNAWSSRLQTDQASISAFDYIVFDILLTAELTSPVTFWMDLSVGDINVFTLQPDGTVSKTDRLYIFNENGESVTGTLSPNITYTFIIKLGHGDPEGRYAFAFAQDMVIYLRNPYVAKANYIENLYNITVE